MYHITWQRHPHSYLNHGTKLDLWGPSDSEILNHRMCFMATYFMPLELGQNFKHKRRKKGETNLLDLVLGPPIIHMRRQCIVTAEWFYKTKE